MNVVTEQETAETAAAYAEAARQSKDPNQRYPGFKAAVELQMQMNRFEALLAATQARNR